MKKSIFFLVFIFAFALFLRLYKLGKVPPGLNWDETALGYTSYSLLKTGKDEWGVKLPLFTKQFGEYKSAIYPYTAIIPIAIFDLNVFSTRLPSALAGALAVLIIYFLCEEIFKKFNQSSIINHLPITASLLLAINPWHLHFSRYALSANLALTFALAGLVFIFKFLNQKKTYTLFLSIIFSSLAVYTYHSFRIVLPLIFIFLFFSFKKNFLQNKKRFAITIGLIILLSLPLFFAFKKGYLTNRIDDVSLFSSKEFQEKNEQLLKENVIKRVRGISFFNNRALLLTEQIFRNQLTHFNADFLFLGNDASFRFGTGWYGKFYYIEAFLIFIGLFFLFKNNKKTALFLLFWILISPLPASLSNESPHPIRAYFLLPALIILASAGLVSLIDLFKNKLKRASFIICIFIFYLLSFILYLNYYYIHFSQRSGYHWQSAYKPLVEYLNTLDQKKYDNILFTQHYGQPYIFLFFYQKFDPVRVQNFLMSKKTREILNTAVDHFENYRFTPIIWEEYTQKENVLIIDTGLHKERKKTSKITGIKLLKSFYFENSASQNNQQHAFSIYEIFNKNK